MFRWEVTNAIGKALFHLDNITKQKTKKDMVDAIRAYQKSTTRKRLVNAYTELNSEDMENG